MLDLTLWKIEDDLQALIEKREELLAVSQSSDCDVAALEMVENQIRLYVAAEVRKVDGIRGYWRMCEELAGAARREAATLTERARAWEGRHEHLKSLLVSVLSEFEWKAGKPKKLEGNTGSISLKGNGGLMPLNVYDESLLPDELRTVTVEMSVKEWGWLVGLAAEDCADCEPFTARVVSNFPNNGAIRAALDERCRACGGCGKLPGLNCSKGPQHLEQCAGDCGLMRCDDCGGFGKAGVPGARLEPRAQHVECK